MDDHAAFERQLAVVLDRMAGPEPHHDAMAIVRAAQAGPTRRRFPIMSNATRLIATGAAVALSGWFIVAAVRGPMTDGPLTADIVASPSPTVSAAAVVTDPCATPLVRVTGTIIWGYQHPGAANVVTETGDHLLDFQYQSRLDMSDDRLDGQTIGGGDWYRSGSAGVIRGIRTIENADGRWEGPTTLSGTQASGFVWMDDLVGSGAYLGLSAILFGDQDETIAGTIYPTDIADCEFSPDE